MSDEEAKREAERKLSEMGQRYAQQQHEEFLQEVVELEDRLRAAEAYLQRDHQSILALVAQRDAALREAERLRVARECIAVHECKKRIRELREALALAWSALASIEDAQQRSELKFEIINILRE